ncbi:MAG: hypothetical protein IKN66_00790 [Ruminococcus sp.]|nr:hypothetical protein [Ruminococcus sp.]
MSVQLKILFITAALLLAGCSGSPADSGGSGNSSGKTGSAAESRTETDASFAKESIIETEPASGNESSADSPAPVSSYSEDENSGRDNSIPKTDDTESMLRLISTVPEGGRLTAFGEVTPSEETMKKLEQQLKALTAGGHRAALLVLDTEKGSGVCFGTDQAFCIQSAIKAIYLGAVAEEYPVEVSEWADEIKGSLTYSENDTYELLREEFGTDALKKLCREAGVREDLADTPYPCDITARELMKLWVRLGSFLSGGSETAAMLRSDLAGTIGSAVSDTLGGKYEVLSKAGWECGIGEEYDSYDPEAEIPENFTDGDPLNDECAANDAGMIVTENSSYYYVILSDQAYGVFENNSMVNPLLGLAGAIAEMIK